MYRHRILNYQEIDHSPESAVKSMVTYLIGPGVCTAEAEVNRRSLCDCLSNESFNADYYLGPLIHQKIDNDFDFFNMFCLTYRAQII